VVFVAAVIFMVYYLIGNVTKMLLTAAFYDTDEPDVTFALFVPPNYAALSAREVKTTIAKVFCVTSYMWAVEYATGIRQFAPRNLWHMRSLNTGREISLRELHACIKTLSEFASTCGLDGRNCPLSPLEATKVKHRGVFCVQNDPNEYEPIRDDHEEPPPLCHGGLERDDTSRIRAILEHLECKIAEDNSREVKVDSSCFFDIVCSSLPEHDKTLKKVKRAYDQHLILEEMYAEHKLERNVVSGETSCLIGAFAVANKDEDALAEYKDGEDAHAQNKDEDALAEYRDGEDAHAQNKDADALAEHKDVDALAEYKDDGQGHSMGAVDMECKSTSDQNIAPGPDAARVDYIQHMVNAVRDSTHACCDHSYHTAWMVRRVFLGCTQIIIGHLQVMTGALRVMALRCLMVVCRFCIQSRR